MKILKKYIALLLCISLLCALTGCAGLFGSVEELKGSITGNTYTCKFYSNKGEQFMTVKGQQIDLEPNIVHEQSYSPSNGWGTVETLSSAMTITIDGNQMVSCGSTILFEEDGLKPDVNFQTSDVETIDSTANGILDSTLITNVVNKYKNYFGKSMIVIVQSQLGDPICAYSGEKVNWKVSEKLPKTTRLTIDGKLLYIHRGNFQIIDKALLN